MTSQHKDLTSQHKDLTSQHNYLTSDGRRTTTTLLTNQDKISREINNSHRSTKALKVPEELEKKKIKLNRFIELRSLFSWINNSFPQSKKFVSSICSSNLTDRSFGL